MLSRNTLTSIGLFVLRVAFGCLMLVHGLQKAAAFSELKDQFADPLGMGNQLSLISAIGAEVGCSFLLILGLGTRLAAIPLAFTMIVALFLVHADHSWKVKELAAAYLGIYVSLIFTGAGQFSLDHLIFKRTPSGAKKENSITN
jgi:putative oxidoreductase